MYVFAIINLIILLFVMFWFVKIEGIDVFVCVYVFVKSCFDVCGFGVRRNDVSAFVVSEITLKSSCIYFV